MPSTTYEPNGAPEELLIEGVLCKSTLVSDVVVKRYCRLYRGRFETFHDFVKDPGNKRTWFLDRHCELSPATPEHIQSVSRWVRLAKVWTVTASVGLANLPSIKLYIFELTWPSTWSVNGYSSFLFGFESKAEAQRWHRTLTECIAGLKELSLQQRRTRKGNGSGPQSSDPSFVEPSAASSVISTASPSHIPVGTYSSPPAPEPPMNRPPRSPSAAPRPSDDYYDVGAASSDEETDLPTYHRPVDDNSKRWVPYRQTNGVAIYHHQQADEDRQAVGGEFMASTVVHGPPRAVLEALLHSANTSILGPATHVEVLDQQQDTGVDMQILRIMLEAPGYAGVFCAPRELLVERLVKVDDTGLFVVMFRSCECEPIAYGEPPPSEADGSSTTSGHSWFRKPVKGWVRGGYTIAPRQGYTQDDSPDSLITCIIKVDLGGVCSARSWLCPFSDFMGWTDAFLDRILMSINLVRDEVEHRGFVLQPFTMASAAGCPPHAQEEVVCEPPASSTPLPTTRSSASRAAASSSGGVTTFAVRPHTAASDGGGAVSSSSSTVPVAAAVAAVAPARSAVTRLVSKQRQAAEPLVQPELTVPTAVADDEPVAAPPPAPFDVEETRALSTLGRKFYEPIHTPGTAAPFVVRGATYLKDKRKVPAGLVECPLASYDFVEISSFVEHIARFLPSIRSSRAPFTIVINIVIPGSPAISAVAAFACARHPAHMGDPPQHPMKAGHDWAPFDFVLHRFYHGDEATRNAMLKLIPHIAEGSWVIRQSVGTTPAILGKALKTHYHMTDRYLEVDVDVSANGVANYVTGLARGATRSLVMDLGFVLEGVAPWELPESLLGAVRLVRLDMHGAKIDMSREVPFS